MTEESGGSVEVHDNETAGRNTDSKWFIERRWKKNRKHEQIQTRRKKQVFPGNIKKWTDFCFTYNFANICHFLIHLFSFPFIQPDTRGFFALCNLCGWWFISLNLLITDPQAETTPIVLLRFQSDWELPRLHARVRSLQSSINLTEV